MSRKELRKHYARVYRSLGRAELQIGAPELDELGLEELFGPTRELWLGFYTQEGLELAIERYGVTDDIRRKGYESLSVETRTDGSDEHVLRLRSELPRFEAPLIELVVRRAQLGLRGELREILGHDALSALSVEWLQLQHPLGTFSAERPPLPGQHLPGIGLARQVFEMLRNVCQRLSLGALVTVPSYLHNAVFYGEGFRYLDPHYQGRFEGMCSRLEEELGAMGVVGEGATLAASSWGLRWGLVTTLDEAGERVLASWPHEPMIAPITPGVADYLRGEWYRAESRAAREQVSCEVLERPLRAQLAEAGIWPFDEERALRTAHEDDLPSLPRS